METVFGIMQQMYRAQWARSFTWESDAPLNPHVDSLDQNLLNGPLLNRVDRTPAVAFHEAAASGVSVHFLRMVQDGVALVALPQTSA